MNLSINKAKYALLAMALGMAISGCQKMTRPALGDFPKDPPPPPYNDLKSSFSFEGNTTDNGEDKLNTTTNAVTYVAGVNGQAAHFGPGGYILAKAIGDTVVYENGFKAVPADTIANLGSFTIAFWVNAVGPVFGGAEGIFAISNSNEFWGNIEMFFENNDNGSEAYYKLHMFNAGVASGNGEEWNEVKVAGALNKWTHIAAVYDAKTSKLNVYFDGVAVIADKELGGGKYGKVKFNNFNGMVLGSYQFQTNPSLTNHGPEGWARSLIGDMDQVHIYNRALSGTEINDLVTSKN